MERDRAFVAGKYDQIWGAVREAVRLMRAGGDDFERLYRRTLESTNGVRNPAHGDAGDANFSFRGVDVSLPVMAREYIWRDLVTSEVMRVVRDDADVIAELGSGWSANLFSLWLRGAPKSALYVGGELTQSGRDAGSELALAEPRMKYTAATFDWSHPDFSFIPADARHVTVYSCYSIKQIPQLDPACLRDLLARTAQAQTVQGVFIEPVGFQFPEHCPYPDIIEPSRKYAQDHNYNLNLRQVMETLARDGRLQILSAAFDAFGTRINPATIIHWQRA